MKSVLQIVLALVIVWVVWSVIRGLLFTALHVAVQLALLALFCFAVYAVYKALSRQKIM